MPEKQYQLFFDDVSVDAGDIFGEWGKRFEIPFETINPERMILAAMCCGMERYALDRAVEYASDRVVFNRPIGAYQSLQHPLAKGKTDIELASLMTRNAACLFDSQVACGEEANMAKFGASTAAVNAIDASLQCFGGNGFTKEYGIFDLYPFARLLKTAPLNNEMVLNFIAEKGMGLPSSY